MAVKTFTVTKQMIADIYGGSANPGDSHLPIGRWDPGTGLSWTTRALLYAPISFAGMVSITEARLWLRRHEASGWHANGTATATLTCDRKTVDWSETSHGSSSAKDETWGGDGDHLVESGITGTGDFANVPAGSEGTWVSIPITNMVRDWFGGTANYGLLLYNATSETDPSKAHEFYSRHVSGSQPYIEVTYETNTAPNAPTNLSPTGDAVRSSNTLSWRHSDPDSGDKATSAHVRVEDNSGNYVGGRLNADIVNADGYACSWGAYPLVSGRRYHWQARTYDGALWGPFCSLQPFYYEPSQPAPTPSTPTGGATVTTLTPTLKGTENLLGDSVMSHSQFEVRPAGGSTSYDSGTVADTGSQCEHTLPGGTLAWGSDYEWRARTRTSLGTWSAWSAWSAFSTAAAGSPQDVTPVNGALEASLTPTIGFTADAGDTIVTWDYEVLTAGGSVHGSETSISGSGSSASKAYAGTALVRGTTYSVRVRYTGTVGGTSPWSEPQEFTVNSAPNAPTLAAPAPGAVVSTLTPTLSWAFEDAERDSHGDTQSAYSIEVRNNATDALIDTLTGTTAVQRVYDGVALGWDTAYKWRVQTTDANGLVGSWSSYRIFTPSQPPTVTGVQIAAGDLDAEGEINGPTPTVEWTFTSPGSKAQSTYRVVIVRTADEGTVYDSGAISGTAVSHAIPNGHLTNGETYRVEVTATDADGLSSGVVASADYVADFAPPAALSGLLTVADPSASKISVQWEASSDPEFDHYEVWRRRYGETAWTVMADNLAIGTTEFTDYTVALNTTYEYAVLQVHTLGTGLVNGDYQPITSALSGVPEWYIVAEEREDLTTALWIDGADEAIPVQQEIIEALGRPFKIVVEGMVLGTEGSITARIDFTEYELAARVEALLRAQLDRVLIKAPSGEVYPSKMSTITKRRIERGGVEVSFPFTETESL